MRGGPHRAGPRKARVFRAPAGFTLIELLVVVAIIALLIAVLLPALARAKEQARIATCGANLRGILTAFHTYAPDNDGRAPHQVQPVGVGNGDWSGALLPVLNNSAKLFRCPSDDLKRAMPGDPRSYGVNGAKYTYLGNGYLSPWPPYDAQRVATRPLPKLADIPPQVFLAGEDADRPDIPTTIANVGNAECESLDAWTSRQHRSGGNYGFVDAHVEFRLAADVAKFRADTDYGGDTTDPWKWIPR